MNAAVVNISGRQRMLSQRAAMLVLRLTMPELSTEERQTVQIALRSTIELMEDSHNYLLLGNLDWNLPGNPSSVVKAMYFEPPILLDQLVRSYVQKVKEVCDLVTTKPLNSEDITDILSMAYDVLLNALDQVVSQYQVESDVEQLAAQAQLVQAEKMSSLGKLVAGVAHEINNPVSFIHGNLSYARTYADQLLNLISLYRQYYSNPPAVITEEIEKIDLDFVIEDFDNVLSSMQLGTERIRQIVLSLRNFSHKDESNPKPANLHDGIDSTLLILKHQLERCDNQPQINVVKQYGTLPLVPCHIGQLNQVFMNLLSNAIDALGEAQPTIQSPTITIQTMQIDDDRVGIRIADNGTGIPPNIQEKMFDTFFTTKSVGKGTGLGLAISRDIVVEKHRGRLSCKSHPGQGTEFEIELPMQAS